jgi:hypothetical protein
MRAPEDRAWLVPLGALLAGAAYEAAVALGVLEVGPEPGAEPPGRTVVFTVAELALLGSALAAAAGAPRARGSRVTLTVVPLAAAAFLVARFYSFDSYYAPTMRRMSDDGAIPPGLVWSLAAGCAGASLLLRSRPRRGRALTAPVLFLVALTALLAGTGH